MQGQGYTESSRKYATRHYIELARRRGEKIIRINAGELHKALGFRQRVPAVCQALQSKKFLVENGLTLEKVEGPPSGQGTRATFTYRLNEDTSRDAPIRDEDAFLKLRGIAKKIFRELGGGEAFIRKERGHFYADGDHR